MSIKLKVNSFGELSTYIREGNWGSLVYHSEMLPPQTEEHLLSLAETNQGLNKFFQKGKTDDLVLLSDVVRKDVSKFSSRKKQILPDKKTVDKTGSIIDLYKALRCYSAAFGVVFSFNERKSNSLCTDFLVKDNHISQNFLVRDFPIESLIPVNDRQIGAIRDLVIELEQDESLGVDYLFSAITGEYITPIHLRMTEIQKRLLSFKTDESNLPDPLGVLSSNAVTEGYKNLKDTSNLLPQTIFLGVEFDSPVFTFGRSINLKVFENIYSATNDYGKNGSDAIKTAYQNLVVKRMSVLYEPNLNEGVAYTTTDLDTIEVRCESTFNPPKRFIPSLEHFKETEKSKTIGKTLRELGAEDIIKLFPETELLILKLAIGRAIIGVSGSTGYLDKEYRVTHDWRKCVILNGRPKIGKSTILSKLSEAMAWCGFTVETGVNLAERFNVKDAVLSDLTIFDDLTEERLVANLKAEIFKSVITSGSIKVEDKGVDKEGVIPKTVLIGNINDLRTETLYEVDSGSKDRFVAISASKAKQKEDPFSLSRIVAKELGVNEVAIWIRILRDCLDTAFKYCEINMEEPEAGISINEKINEISLSNLTYFDSQPGITFLILCLVVAAYETKDCNQVLRELNQSPQDTCFFFDLIGYMHNVLVKLENKDRSQEVRDVIEKHWVETGRKTPSHPHLALRELRISSLIGANNEKDSIVKERSFKAVNIPEGYFDNVLQECKNQNGSIRKKFSGLKQDWRTIKECEEYQNIVKEIFQLF